MGQFDDIFGVKTPDDSGVAVSGEYDDIFGIKPQRTLKTNLQDVAATAAKGITGLSDAAIGLANIPTMGQAGRAAQLVGLNEVYDDPMQAEQALQEHQQNVAAGKRNEFLDASPYSAPQQFAQKQVTDAEGVLGKLGAAVRNPSTIATAVGESVPSMLAGGMIGRGLAVGTKLSPVVGGAIGEGVVGAGAAAEQTRKESPTGTLTPQQTAMAVGSGVGTGIFGYVGGKVANKLGFDDADTLIANGFQRVAKKSAADGAEVAEKGFAQNAAEVAGRIVGGGISEGAFEELPQTIQETMWQNAATGKPLTEGMDEAAVMGFLSGVAMGGTVNALPRPTQTSPEQTQTAPTPGPISRAADMLARTTPGIMGKVMDPALAPLPEDNLSGEWNAQEQQALAGNQARNFTRAEQAAYDLEQQRQAQQAEARRQADPLAAQKAAFEESYNAMGTVPESMGNITPEDAAAFERKVEFERATNRRQQYIKAWKQAEQEADTLTRDPEIPAAVKREARKQVREIVKADPVYEQMNEVKRRGGLNLEAMGQDYDRDTVNIINRRYPGIFSRVGSVKPDDFANEMGYDDLDAMVRRFSEARTQKELTASILKEKTGSWQNAESEQQAYAAKQAERKQGAEWAGAQGADSVSRGIPARTVFPAPDEAVSAMESMIRRKPENFKEEDFDHWTYTAEQQGRLKQAYREAVNGGNSEAGKGNSSVQESGAAETGRNLTNPNQNVPGENQTPSSQPSMPVVETDIQPGEEVSRVGLGVPDEVAATDPLPRDIGATQPARMERDTGEYLQGQRERRDFYKGNAAVTEADTQNFIRDQQGRRSFQGVDNTPQSVAGNPSEFLRDQEIRRDAVGKVSEPMRRQPGESTRDFLKRRKAGKEVAAGESFDVGHASEAAYNQPQNAAIRDAWTRANIVQDSDGTARRMQHDHFDEWHAGGGVSAGIGSQYDAHGIAKSNPLGALLNLLQNGIDTTRRFDTAPLVTNSGTSAGLGAASGAYKDGPFIILGKKGKELKEGIHTVLVSDAVSGVIPQLQQRFPGVRFVKYSEAQATLENDSANVSPNQKNETQANLSPTGETQNTATGAKTNSTSDLPGVGAETAPSKGAASTNPPGNPTVKESLTVQDAPGSENATVQDDREGAEGGVGGKPVEKPVAKPSTKTTPGWAEEHAKEVGGKVVFHDNEVALIEGFSMTGKLVFSGVSKEKDSRTRVGISTYTGDLFTAEQKQRLIDAETHARKMDEQLHRINPDGPFLGKGKFATSANTPAWAAEFTENLLKMLGIDARVYLTTIDDAKSATNFHGPFAAIRSASVTSDRTLAETRQLPNGDMYIVFRPTSGKTLLLETLAHEVGHIVEKTAWKEATDSERAAVLEDFRAWRDRKGIPAREWVNSMRALRSARNTTVPAGVESDDMTPYWKSFSEYFADQVSRWAVSSDKPLSVVEIFFKKIAVSLRRIYASLSGERFLPAASMRAYLDKRSAAFIYMREGAGADIVAESKKQQLEGNVVDKTVDKRADKSAAEKSVDSEFAGNKVFTADKVAAARARLKAKRGSLSSGFDPELMQDMLIIGGAHFEAGVRKFSAWSKAVMADIGEEFKPFLRGTYENLRHYPGIDKEGMSTAAEIEGINIDAIGKQADNTGKEQSPPAEETNKEATDVQANSQSIPEAEQSGRTEPSPNRGEGIRVPADAGAELSGTGRPDRQANDGKSARRSDRTGKGAQYGADDRQGSVNERHGGIYEQPVTTPQNYRITEADRIGKGGAKQKARDNIKAIRIIKQLSQEGRPATAEEQAQLVKYVGWGASELANGVFPQKKYEPSSRRYVDSYKDDWKAIGEELRAALTDEEYNAAKASTINAHYTSEKIIKGMYAALERFGYTGKGKALEPGSGVGHFIGLLPDAFTAGTRFTTVEMDPISAGIAKALYPGHDVRQADFTKFKAPDNFFDIAIGNPPFADIEIVSDHDYAEKKFKLHDYFFAKSIDKVRPGGLMVLVTSRYTMDKGNDKARSYLAKRADLLGAIRLPQTAFKENAGTEVVTDVLFLRKRLEGERPAGQAWGRLEPVQAGDKKIHVNEYFASHPEMVLGKHSTAGSMYGPGQYTVDPNKGDIAEQFAQAVANLPENVYQTDKSSPSPTDNQTIEAEWSPQSVKEGAFYLDDKGELRQKENGMGAPVVGMGKKKAVVKDFVRIRDAVRQVLYVQLKDEGDLAAAQQELGDAYDAFVAAHGPINKTTEVASTNKTTGKESVSYRYPNFSHFKADPDAYLVAAIEKYDDATRNAEKTDIFTKRVISPPAEPRVESLVDALHVSLHQAGEVDVPLIAKMMGVDEDTAIGGLSGAIYLDPNGNRWVTADEYLSGNVRRKLAAARAAADIEPKYKANVAALEAVQPQDLPPSRIKVSLGMPIIQAEEVESFAAEIMQMGISVRHIAATGTWAVAKRSGYQTLVATNDYGTNRLDAADLIDAALNNRTVKVYDRDSDGKQVFNRDATEAAFAKLQKIRERFSQWAWEDAGRSTLLARKFNDLYNNTVKREYGGDHIKQMRFPGMSAVITPHEHQKRVAWRIVQRGNTYMAHSVGAGKTIGSIIAGMELKRLGIKKKPMWVVPNHMLKQFSSEFQQLYPAAKLLVADEEQFAKGNRNRFMGRIAAENWDGIIITHSAFGKIPVSEEYQSEFIGEQIAELEDMMVDADGDRTKTKQLERQKKRLEQRLERILNNASKDKGVSFEESGIDQLFVDEAHQFRKLDFVTNQTSISGIDPNGSLMAFDLYVKTRYLETMYPGRSMVMMSGTPVTNTIGEVYTIQRFLSEPALRELDIHNFDAWAATFGESVTELVATPAGTYQPKTRFGRFRNMPSLAGMWGEIGDFVHAKDLPYLKRPMVDGGGRKMIIGQSSDIQKAYKQSLAARIKAIKERKGPPQKGDDILLTVITDGRHAALDERFIAPEAKARKDAKLEMLVDKVHGIWDESAEKRSTQMIFADLGLPQAESTRGFSVYKHIKQELMRRGVPEAEIAFMQDYKKSDEKQKLFKAMNNGDVRVLIGSSAAMGTGVNAQRKLVALHHFDPDTYLPSNIEQREGRIVRQGNENEQVQLYVYLTRGSYDETMWQFIESKQRFIDQFLAGSVTEDTVEDIDGAANQYAEARAMSSDNPLVLELAGLENDISKLESLRRVHVDGQVRMARDRSAWKSRIGTIEKLIPMVEAAAKARVDTKGERFAMTVSGKNYKVRADAGEKLIGLLKSQAARPVMVEAHDIGEIAGFTLKARSNTLDPRDMVFTLWHGKTELSGKVEDRYNKVAIENGLEKEPSPSGLVMRLENLARGVDELLEGLKDELAKAEHVIKEADNRMGAKFEQLDALEDKRARADEIRAQLAREGSENQESTGPGEQEVKLSKSTSSITPSSSPADIRAEVSAKLGKFRTMQLMRRGVLNVVATQGEAEADIQNKEDAFRSEQTGAIQGYVKNGKVTLVADGIQSGNAYQVFLHEITHATRLGLNSNANFKRLLDTIERHKGQDTALGKAIDAAEARIPADTKPEHRTEEILSYLIENDRVDVGIVRRFIAMVKKVLVNMGVSPDIFSKEDFKALAVNAAKRQSTMATGGNVMRSVGEMFKPVDPNSPALKRWQGNSQLTEPVFHGSPKEFWTFDKNRVGKNTTSPGAGLGFFFATNRAESQGYAGPSGSLRSFYVKAENPKYMNASDLPRFRGVDEAQAYAKRQQLAGYDSIILEDEGHVIVFEPNQVKSAEINTGAFDAGNDDVRYSVAGGGSGITGNGPGPVWATPHDSKTDSFIYNAQDKLIDMKRIQDNIEKALGPIQEQHDVRMAEELYHKRAAKRVEDVLVAEVNPLMKELGSIPSADLSEFEEYMHALHAPEANESLRQRNPNEQELKALKEAAKADRDNLQQSAIVRRFIDKERELAAAERDVEAGDADDSLIAVINDELESLRDEPIVGKYIKAREKHRKLRHAQPFGGDNTALSGMSNEAAESLLANMSAAKLRKYKALAAKWRRFMDKTRDTLVQYELESQETVDSWAEAFENYVPLHREDMENGMGIGQGFSVKGSATRSRTGSNRKVVDIIAHIVAQRERAIVRGEKAAISRALYGLAAANPNPDVWTIETPPVVREFDPVTGLVVSRPDPMYKNKPNAVVHRFIDEKGHVEERAVLFNEQSERGMRLAQALKNLDTEQLGAILRTSAVLTRWFSAINTQYNLVFGPVNAIRDAGSAMLHLTDTPLAGRQTQVAKRIATGIKPLFKAIWAEASGTPLDTDIAKAWHELQIEGGTTGFRDMFENAEERAEELKRAMLSTTKSRIAAKLSWAKQQVSQYNDVMENCTRLAVYMESRDQGLSKAKSASLAKNITLNFNRKGKVASQAGAMYAFFNASMQGTEKMYRTMTGPAGKKILAGGLLLGASQAVLLAAAGFGDDEPPEFIKERALIIPVGGKKYVTIPMPLGFNIIPNVARVATEWMLSGGKDTGERVTGLIGSFVETFNPIGNAGFSVQTIAPTVIDPLVALSENKDWTGKPIAKQNFNTLKPTPGHERMKDTASAVGIGLSRLLNFLSGGTEYTPGSLSPTPDQIDYLIGQAFGGVGRESLKTAQVVGTMYTGEDLPVYKIPLVSRFYGDSADSSAASTAFYRNVKRMNVHAAEIEGLTENRGDVAGYMADHPEAKYVRRTEATYRRVQKLQKVKRTLLNNDAPRAKVEAVEKSISSLMSSYNNYVKER